jgi:hypothetical protein
LVLSIAIRNRQGADGKASHVIGWGDDTPGAITAPAEITLLNGTGPGTPWLRLSIDPALPALTALAADGMLHYFRFADATLRPLPPAPALLRFARGDAYIAVLPGALRLASPSIARFVHLRDDFNADRLAQGLLDVLAEQAGPAGLSEAVTVLVVEAR